MTQTGSKGSESRASNDNIPYTLSPSEVVVDVDTSKKRNPWNLELIVGSIFTSSPLKMELVKPNGSIVQNLMQRLYHLMCLIELGLDNVFTITVDNASSNDVTVKEMSKNLSDWGSNIMDCEHLHLRFTVHILNIILQDGLKEIDPRNKLDYVPFAIVDMFGKEVWEKQCSEVKKYMNKMFEYYVKKSPKTLYKYHLHPLHLTIHQVYLVTGGHVLDPLRSSLNPKIVQPLGCVQDWLRSEPFPINIEEDLEYLEQLELDFACSGTESSIIDIWLQLVGLTINK
ncbi:hypothetical protein EJD97_004479 [Solanum chilense]|uniref:hAT-like transposase RNase-H fold domain-containing protein n=1 Tax=Solanum chilense TaxID=4083 RepID=A0A6N2BWA2_SOLCI|nr:hypothetical protein EJD97_004479 [Solanum chilense]